MKADAFLTGIQIRVSQQFLTIDCCAKFATGLKWANRHRSKSMRVTKLFFCQIDPTMSASFWQKNRLDTRILFDLCLFEHFSPVANFAQQSIEKDSCLIYVQIYIIKLHSINFNRYLSFAFWRRELSPPPQLIFKSVKASSYC